MSEDKFNGANTADAQRRLNSSFSMLSRIRDEMGVWNYRNAADIAARIIASVPLSSTADGWLSSGALCLLASAHLNRVESMTNDASNYIQTTKELLSQAEAMAHGDEALSAEIRAIKASIANLEQGDEAALDILSEATDFYAIRARLSLLLKRGAIDDARHLLDGLEPHEHWCDLAVAVYALSDQIDRAQSIASWAARLTNRHRHPQCLVRMADAMLARALASQPENVNIQPRDISPQVGTLLSAVINTIQPILHQIKVADAPASELDISALRIAWRVCHLLQRHEAVTDSLVLMIKWTPIPIDVARGVVSGVIEAPTDLPDRLRRDHPNDFEAGLLASVIQSQSHSQHREAFEFAKELLPFADIEVKKEQLFRLLQQVWQHLEGPVLAECETLAEWLVEHNAQLRAVFTASIALRSGDADQALSILDEQEQNDDPYWLQMKANALLWKQQPQEASDFLLMAAKKTLDPNLLHKAGDLASQIDCLDDSVWCFERLAEIQPSNISAQSNLAYIYAFKVHDLEKAAVQFRALRKLEPDNAIHTFNLAVCLTQLFLPDESLALYDELCARENPTLLAVLGRAQLYHSLGQPGTALASLNAFRESFWDEPDFLTMFMTTAHAAGNDEAGHEALMQLDHLREAGKTEPNPLRLLQRDEGLDFIKQSLKGGQERAERFHDEILKGRMPWIWADQLSELALYQGWRTRTQEMTWINNAPTNRARYSIYATNGFHIRESAEGRRELLPLDCPPAGSRVVADISALITLHRLGLLDAAAEHFGEILVPAGYLPTVLEDSRKMVLHQRSQQSTAAQISRLVHDGRITVMTDASSALDDIPVADEYTDADSHHYRLLDVIQPLFDNGRIDDSTYSRVSRLCMKPSAVDDTRSALCQSQDLIIDLTTLETIAHLGVQDTVAMFYSVMITSQAYREVIQRLNAIEYLEETRGWHINLWSRIRNDQRFTFVQHTVPEAMAHKEDTPTDYLPFLSSFVAQKTAIPLLVDDRACQMLTLNEAGTVPHPTFSSDGLICRLMAEGLLNAITSASALKNLMAWRYRFIVPTPEVLKALADQYRGNPPGEALREVSEYVHDCMRDEGLLNRHETDLGDSIAMRCYMTWLTNIAEFIVLVWADDEYSEQSAVRLTEWSCREFIPSCPRRVEAQLKIRGASSVPVFILSHALFKSLNYAGQPRMADMMKAVKESLRISDDEYTGIITGMLHDTARTFTNS